jgi:hypothetical protein
MKVRCVLSNATVSRTNLTGGGGGAAEIPTCCKTRHLNPDILYSIIAQTKFIK